MNREKRSNIIKFLLEPEIQTLLDKGDIDGIFERFCNNTSYYCAVYNWTSKEDLIEVLREIGVDEIKLSKAVADHIKVHGSMFIYDDNYYVDDEDADRISVIVIPANVTNVDLQKLDGCYNSSEIRVDPNNSKYKAIDGNLCSKDGRTLIFCPPNHYNIVPDGIKVVAEHAFYYDCGSDLDELEIPASVERIEGRLYNPTGEPIQVTYKGTRAQLQRIAGDLEYSDIDLIKDVHCIDDQNSESRKIF